MARSSSRNSIPSPGCSFSYHSNAASTSRSTDGSETNRYSITSASWPFRPSDRLGRMLSEHESGHAGTPLGAPLRVLDGFLEPGALPASRQFGPIDAGDI